MSDEANDVGEVIGDAASAAQAEEMAALMAGYNNTAVRAEQAPAEVVAEPTATPEEVGPVIEPATPSQATQAPSLADELAALKAKVKSMGGDDPEAVRRMHGEIGEINRTLKRLTDAQPKPEPVKDELTLAIEEAEAIATEFPEMAGPLVKAMKLLNGARAQAPAPEVGDIDTRVANTVTQLREREAIEALVEEHPDYETVRDTPEFKAWEASKTPEFQHKLRNTWNPAVVARGLTEFKESLKTKQKKQDRLASAVVTPGASAQAKPSTLPDEAGLMVGYNSGPKRQIFNR
jgi:hypothetical protein